MYRLNKAGYESWLVGGGVRDLLLGKKPKDFDVTTNATPDQVRKLFRNCRLVGRRFRLAHVMFGPEIIEVATFRGHHEGHTTDRVTSQQGQNGMLLRITSSARSKRMPSVATSPSIAFITAWLTLPFATTSAA